MTKKVLTGITPSGISHLGNYVGMYKPAIELSHNQDFCTYYFIADHHSLIKLQDAKLRREYITQIAATWLALGVDPDQSHFYRQSDIPEITEILNLYQDKFISNREVSLKIFNTSKSHLVKILLNK